jgi:hypothetical protein
MSKMSNSPERHTFQAASYKKKLEEDPSNKEAAAMVEWYENWKQKDLEREADLDWQKDNLEYDLRSTDWILEKVRHSDSYAQNLYAAMCNNDFQKLEVIPILSNQTWSCSWRYAGGIIADMRQEGDYINWYCSGIGAVDPEYVAEMCVTDEIKADLGRLGWAVVTQNDLF